MAWQKSEVVFEGLGFGHTKCGFQICTHLGVSKNMGIPTIFGNTHIDLKRDVLSGSSRGTTIFENIHLVIPKQDHSPCVCPRSSKVSVARTASDEDAAPNDRA